MFFSESGPGGGDIFQALTFTRQSTLSLNCTQAIFALSLSLSLSEPLGRGGMVVLVLKGVSGNQDDVLGCQTVAGMCCVGGHGS